ncbi:MAG: sigma 54-interacting transcriptional regulator [Geobacteraceae bacterium]|nr:sigma 54-interacting transcriptional regulator [Geobacteraceae bacterium]
MKIKTTLTKANRDFFQRVAAAAFANPFGERRDELDVIIAGVTTDTPALQTLDAVLAKVADSIEQLSRSGRVDLRSIEGEERALLRGVFLFHIFHRYQDQFDRLIQEQIKGGDTPCRVLFAREMLAELSGFGLGSSEAVQIFAQFYQLRRAFYFIRSGLVGSSPAMRTLRMHLWNSLFTHDIRWFESRLWDRMEDFSLLLLGETGTGKGAAAAAIGRSGFIPFDPVKNCFTESFTRNFTAINLSQYSEGVLESELFGHRKGAFTGAVDNFEGLFSRSATHGVIFLDEIGDISLPVQLKLLQVLQERTFSPVGSHEVRRFNGRIVAATNRPIDQLISEGKFRDDFYYRLCSDVITLPPLRERLKESPDEMNLLLDNILDKLTKGRTSQRERQLIRKVLEHDLETGYAWPGNVRELEQAVKRIVITGHYCGVKRGGESSDAAAALAVEMREGKVDAEGLLVAYCTMLHKQFGTYEEVARRTNLDRRTVKKYISQG